MGGGRWNMENYARYNEGRGRQVDRSKGVISGDYNAQEMYQNHTLSAVLNPYKAIRECCDSQEHPNTLPVILALDVTGSMGRSAVEFAKKLNVVMTSLLKEMDDVEFMVAAIGDFYCDRYPFQAGQFESDIRIAEQLDEICFEAGGGGNAFESYTAAWYFGAYHTKLDCWKRGKKGIIITIGDELINPYIPKVGHYTNFADYMGDPIQGDILTTDLYQEVIKKYNVYHMVADHNPFSHRRVEENVRSFAQAIGEQHVSVVTVESIAEEIIAIVNEAAKENQADSRVNYAETIGCLEENAINGTEQCGNSDDTPSRPRKGFWRFASRKE